MEVNSSDSPDAEDAVTVRMLEAGQSFGELALLQVSYLNIHTNLGNSLLLGSGFSS